jgi:hypothetical protein
MSWALISTVVVVPASALAVPIETVWADADATTKQSDAAISHVTINTLNIFL